MNYKFSVTGLGREDHEQFKDVVTQLYWRLVCTDADGTEGSFSGATPIEDLSQLDELTFITYEDLKEETIIKWIETMLGKNPAYKQHILDRIADEIHKKRARKEAGGFDLPWAGAPSEPIKP